MKMKYTLAACAALGLLLAGPARAGTEEVIYSFQGGKTDGANPGAGLVAIGGVLYGITYNGGPFDVGTVFSVTAQGSERVLHGFQGGSDGAGPATGLTVFGRQLYGTTSSGTGFVTSIAGTEQPLFQFTTNKDGEGPSSRLLRVGGAFYGTTIDGGLLSNRGHGTFYKLGGKENLRVLHTFHFPTDGSRPFGDLIYENGAFIGTTLTGGAGFGTIYSLTPDGTETVLHVFRGSDGASPNGGLLDVGGTLYGTASGRGNPSNYGTVFKLAPDGTFTVLHAFAGGSDGAFPNGNLVEVNGTIYGTTFLGGPDNRGTIFTIAADGTYAVAYTFCCNSARRGAYPTDGLTLVNGSLYGMTANGGARDVGTVFRYRP